MEPLFDVIKVEPQEDHTLRLVFENDEHRLFDMTPYLDKKPYTRLKQVPLFLKARVAYGTVVWPGNIDIAPETLWDHSTHAEQVVTQERQKTNETPDTKGRHDHGYTRQDERMARESC